VAEKFDAATLADCDATVVVGPNVLVVLIPGKAHG
jgi:hypothetical protein